MMPRLSTSKGGSQLTRADVVFSICTVTLRGPCSGTTKVAEIKPMFVFARTHLPRLNTLVLLQMLLHQPMCSPL